MKRINPREKVFTHLDRIAAWQAGQRPAPVTIEWDLSNRCPWGCLDCHFAHTHTRGPWTRQARLLPLAHDPGGDLADPVVVRRALSEAAKAGVKAVVWTGGGEPTTHPDHPALWQHAHAIGLQQGLYTLGALLTPETLAFLREAFSWVVISLDAHTAESYAAEKRTVPHGFAKACEAVRALSGGWCDVGVSFLLHERNVPHVEAMVALGRELGATYTTLRPTIRTAPSAPGVPMGDRAWVADVLPLLERLQAEPDVEVDPARFAEWANWTTHPYELCRGIALNTTITPDGRVWVCPNRRAYGDGHSLLGDLRTESFSAIWSRHPGALRVDDQCRAQCRLHPLNATLAQIHAPRVHGAFL